MKRMIRWMISVLCLSGVMALVACNENGGTEGRMEWHTYKVAVVLPMDGGLDAHWKRTLAMFDQYAEQIFANQKKGVKLQFEWYDETSENIEELAESLVGREDITAVIGGLYSTNAEVLARVLGKEKKTYFTLATTEELVRAHAANGHLWALTETDITQCEVLLSKAQFYGAESVSLLVNGSDSYGKTFVDWFAFQARELGLEVKAQCLYDENSLEEQAALAAASQADYVICVPSEIDDIKPMLTAFRNQALEEGTAPRTLFSDTAFGADVIEKVGSESNGLEGVAFGADPESGFEVSYKVFFGEDATLGEAQAYDAALLLHYALWYTLLHPETELNEALRYVVDGRDLNMGSWMPEDMQLVVNALARGGRPDVRGASGSLDFDAKVYTNVLHTVYYNYMIYNGRYIITDYNSSDGSKRVDATLAGWNWKATKMQHFDELAADSIIYPGLKDRWALLVAASKGWANYRHQADVLAMYQQLKKQGYDDDHIVLIMEDDIAYHSRNKNPGVVSVKIGGENVYHDVQIDYRLSELDPSDIGLILNGEKSERLPAVIESTENDNVLVFWSGHGLYGQLCWGDGYQGFDRNLAGDTFRRMSEEQRFRKLLFLIETCYSGSVAEVGKDIPGALFITAANDEETSKADIFNEELGVWMTNRFTSTLLEQIAEDPGISFRDLYYKLFVNTVGSHVSVYNAECYGSIYHNSFGEYLGKQNKNIQ